MSLSQEMATAIFRCTSELASEARFDRTFTAKITEFVSKKKCKVLYCGKTYTCAIYTSYEVGDRVMVCIPCGNENDSFVVLNCTR